MTFPLVDIHADIEALTVFRDALERFRLGQRAVLERGDHEIETTRASLESKAARWRARLDQRLAALDACRRAAAEAAAAGRGAPDCSGCERAVHEAEERLAHVRRWQQRVEQEAGAFRGAASQFRTLLEADLPRTDGHLQKIIKGLRAARGIQIPGG